jgi:uncharacterized membrane-anchored protein
MKKIALNARPTPELPEGSSVFCYSFLRQNEIDIKKENAHTLALITHNSLIKIENSLRLEIYLKDNIELRKEIHHEFVSYAFLVKEKSEIEEKEVTSNYLPLGWLNSFPGKQLAKIHISFGKGSKSKIPQSELTELFESNQLISNMVEKDSARLWTDFYGDSHNESLRVVIEDFTLGPKRRGRLSQNILELENYRSLAEISFPIAEKIVFELESKEIELASIVKRISQVTETELQQGLLSKLLELSVVSENWRSETGHRFSATMAYRKIFEDRLGNLNGSEVMGYQPFSKFLNKNTMPTFRTCEAANDRLNVFIARIDRAISLLSTQIRSTMEQQNNALLASVNKQNKQQITLQETIEAFAVVAISYNGTALIKMLLESLKAQGFLINIPLWVSISIPSTLVISYVLMRFLRKRKSTTK